MTLAALSYNEAVVFAGVSILGATAGVIGTFAVLRRRALTGDALGHATLPGLCLGFLVAGERSQVPLMIGALATGVLAVAVIAVLRRWTRLKEDAAIAMVLSVFYGAGIVLMTYIINNRPGGGKSGLREFLTGKTASMGLNDVYLLAGLGFGTMVLVAVLFKEMKMVTFDAGFARVQGWPAFALDFLLMFLLAVAVVIGLSAVGVVLISALLVTPAAAARFWTQRLFALVLVAGLIGTLAGVGGAWLSATYNIPAGPAIVLVASAFFFLSLLVGRERGLILLAWRHGNFRRTLIEQKSLCRLFDVWERLGKLPDADLARTPLHRLQRRGWIQHHETGWGFTSEGLEQARHLSANYRLWHEWVTQNPEWSANFSLDDIEDFETTLPADVRDRLIRDLQRQGRWPREAAL